MILSACTGCGDITSDGSIRHCQLASPLEDTCVSSCLHYDFNSALASQIGTIESQFTDTLSGTWHPDSLCGVAAGAKGCVTTPSLAVITSWYNGAAYAAEFCVAPKPCYPGITDEQSQKASCEEADPGDNAKI